MATVANAIQSLELNDTPYWWLFNGSSKVGQNISSADMADSLTRFRQIVELQPPGNYKLTGAKNPNDNRGGTSINFTISKDAPANAMQNAAPVVSTNAYNIPDHVYQQIVQKAQQDFMFQQMYNEFQAFMKDWPEFKKRIEKIEKIEAYLKDEDQDGTPDILQMAKQATDTVKSVSEIKSVFEGGLFGSK